MPCFVNSLVLKPWSFEHDLYTPCYYLLKIDSLACIYCSEDLMRSRTAEVY